ncbi:hypothetical protein KKF97_15185 [Myxococcota bacterium]|nr:hypothetical protein [Myxococcota bacterium]MBU1382784.1 hypothetical protein [Myxococcota bacterium]MBU1502659.1 hypothetical protein [bacterium]
MNIKTILSATLTAAFIFTSCNGKKDENKTTVEPNVKKPEVSVPIAPEPVKVTRELFNITAIKLNIPVFWIADSNSNEKPDPGEISSVLFYDSYVEWVKDGKFTPDFSAVQKKIENELAKPTLSSGPEADRIKLVINDLEAGYPVIVYNDMSTFSAEDKAIVAQFHKLSILIDKLYKAQLGIDKITANDAPSKRMMERNLSPMCKAPLNESNVACTAVAGVTKQVFGIYPAKLQEDKDFCKKLVEMDKKERNPRKHLLHQFNGVVEKNGKLTAEPYNVFFKDHMTAISAELKKTAELVKNPKEKALKAYLSAAAKGFETNNWDGADKAWAAMNAKNSRYYIRIAPDEVYWDPCNSKAGFHFTFSLINPKSLEWQNKLMPIKNDMEKVIAAHIGAPYRARPVKLHLPDFIDIVTNAGNDRSPFGGTIGQSLPNWGPVAKAGGKTVVMANLYTDADSMRMAREKAESMIVSDGMKTYPSNADPGLLSIILHEVTHNLGPVHEYVYKGKKDKDWFGPALSTTLEELKAQTGALWYVNFLLKKKIIDEKMANQTYLDSILWGFGHISRGMYGENRKPKPYSHLAAIQVGFLMEEKAMVWDPTAMAANGKDKGAFKFDLAKFPGAVDKLMKIVGQIKASGNKAKAEELVKKYVDGAIVPMEEIKKRILRFPKNSFVYGYKL